MMKLKLLLASILMMLSACASLPGKQSLHVDGINYSYAKHGSGQVNVVFVTGLGSEMDSAWDAVFTRVSEFAPVFAYDRQGYGDSKSTESDDDSASEAAGELVDMVVPGASLGVALIRAATEPAEETQPVTGNMVASRLHRLLGSLGIRPPYVLVGHSSGGMYVQNFTHLYPDEVAGLVLVDSRPVEMTRLCNQQIEKGACSIPEMLLKVMPDHVVAEVEGFSATEDQLRSAGLLQNIPVAILASTQEPFGTPDGLVDLKIKLQKEHAERLPQGQFVLASKSGHFIQHDEPELVIQTIRQVVVQARAQSRRVMQ